MLVIVVGAPFFPILISLVLYGQPPHQRHGWDSHCRDHRSRDKSFFFFSPSLLWIVVVKTPQRTGSFFLPPPLLLSLP